MTDTTDTIDLCLALRKQRGLLADGQQRRAANPETSVWVEASAGTGKTKVLSDRVLQLLLHEVSPTRILCLTYTKAAAVEMKTRISKRLSQWSVTDENSLDDNLKSLLGTETDSPQMLQKYRELARTLFARLLDTPGGIKIQTIHGFCQDILKRFPLESGVSPFFELIDDREAETALHQIQYEILNNSSNAVSDATKSAVSYLTENAGESSFHKTMHKMVTNRAKIFFLLNRYNGLDNFLSALRRRLHLAKDQDKDSVKLEFMQSLNHDEIIADIEALLHGSAKDIVRAATLQNILQHGLTVSDYDVYKGIFISKENKRYADQNLATKNAQKADSQVLERMIAMAERIIEIEHKLTALDLYASTAAFFKVAETLLNKYDKYKQQRARLDYEDLIYKTGDLLRNPSVASWVLYKLDGGIDHILLDEAQDTSPAQWEIIQAVSDNFFTGDSTPENPRTLFVVGDRKQSIFSFQGADPQKFDAMSAYFAAKAGKAFQKINLGVSFRSAPAILEAVNNLYADSAVSRGVVAPNETVNHLPIRTGEYGKVEVWPLPVVDSPDNPDNNDDDNLPPLEMQIKVSARTTMARRIAAKIRQMVDDSVFTSSPLHYRDFMVLVRHRNEFVDEFIRACKKMHVNISGADKMILSQQIAVQDLISFGRFLLLPSDDLSLAEVLKSPLFGFTDHDLEELCYNRGETYLWTRLNENPQYHKAAQQISALLKCIDYIRPFELYNKILAEMDGRQKFIARMGPEVEDALDEFINLTLTYEREQIPSLQGFISWFEQSEVVIKREGEQQDIDAVRLMTVHHSKGLQAPVVFLPDTVQPPFNKNEQDLLIDSDIAYYPLNKDFYEENCLQLRTRQNISALEEYRRLLYVALTRAEKMLFICGYNNSGKAHENSWYNLCAQSLKSYAVIHDDETMSHESPEIISPAPIRYQPTTEKALTDAAWLTSPVAAESALSKPYAPSVGIDETEPDSSSPLAENGNFYRRGTLIHKLLQFLPQSTENRAEICREFLAKNAADFTAAQRLQIENEVLNLLNNPQYKALFAADSQAEVPIMGEVDGKIISAQIDRLLIEPDKITIIDFKTNRPAAANIAQTPPVYLSQLQTYAKLLQKIYPSRAVEAYILWTNEPRLMQVI